MGGPQTRFQVASRLGAFRSVATFSDPFGTGAKFHIVRKGSNAHQAWEKSWLDTDPLSSAYLEEQMLGDETVVLTKGEIETVDAARKETACQPVVEIIDRLVTTTQIVDKSRAALKRAVDSGVVKLSDAAIEHSRRHTEEALFLLSGWSDLLDADSQPIEFSPEVARELLTNDTPVTDPSLADLLLSLPCWRFELKRDDQETVNDAGETVLVPQDPIRIVRPDVRTLGKAYLVWVHWASEQAALFREQAIEAAVKNSEAPSGQIN